MFEQTKILILNQKLDLNSINYLKSKDNYFYSILANFIATNIHLNFLDISYCFSQGLDSSIILKGLELNKALKCINIFSYDNDIFKIENFLDCLEFNQTLIELNFNKRSFNSIENKKIEKLLERNRLLKKNDKSIDRI